MSFDPVYLEAFDYDETDECLVLSFNSTEFVVYAAETPGSNFAIVHFVGETVLARARIPSRLGFDTIIKSKFK